MSKHTKTPWKVFVILHSNCSTYAIGKTQGSESPEEADANAALIELAVNSREELLEAAKAVIKLCESTYLDDDEIEWKLVDRLNKAIEKAEGK